MFYKIVEKHPNGEIKTLFHGVNKSRTLPQGVWLEAEEKIVTDGSSGTKYISGFHILKSKEYAESFLKKRFRKRLELLKVVPCLAEEVRPKAHSPFEVYLARRIMFV